MKTLLRILALLALVTITAAILPVAQAATDEATAVVSSETSPWIGGLVASHPWIATALVIIGALRVTMKPIMAAVHAWAASTPSTRDDEIVAQVEASWWWRTLCWLLDWTASIKVGPQKSAPATTTPAAATTTPNREA